MSADRASPPSGAPVRVLVTRPAREAAHWVQQLQARGLDAQALPLIEIVPAAAPADRQALQQAWQALAGYAACMFVSSNAAAYFFAEGAAQGRALPPALRCLAPGLGTVAALRLAGVPGEQIDAPPHDAGQFDSEALWQVVGARDWRGRRVLIVRGHSAGPAGSSLAAAAGEPAASAGRDWMARQWQAAGAQVDFVAVYERQPPLWTPAQWQLARAARGDGSVWLFSSSEAVAHLGRLLPGDWRGARALATHPRIAQAARDAGWGVVVASRPALDDIEALVRSIESLQHE